MKIKKIYVDIIMIILNSLLFGYVSNVYGVKAWVLLIIGEMLCSLYMAFCIDSYSKK